MGSWFRIVTLGIVLSLVIGGRASAAPQILGLLATMAPTPLTCDDGMCSAQFSAFCLQQHRKSPTAGTAYRPAEGTVLTLTYTGPDGVEKEIPAGHLVTVQAHREFHAVRISVPERDIHALGGNKAGITVGSLASLVPIAQPGDKLPLDSYEIAYITGPHRKAVEKFLDPETSVSAQSVSRLISALPRGKTTAARRSSLWRDVMGDAPTRTSHAGLLSAERDYLYCKRWADTGRGYGLRDCLEEMHDYTTTGITKKAWDVSQPGM
jgi:hypothetical protein